MGAVGKSRPVNPVGRRKAGVPNKANAAGG
jgi:hypothetical protein